MPFVRLKMFLIISFALHIVALFIVAVFFHPSGIIAKPQLIPVGVISKYKDPGVGSGNSVEQPLRKLPKPKRVVEQPPKESSKLEKKVVKRVIKKQQRTPEKNEIVNLTNESPSEQSVIQPSQNNEGANESASTTVVGLGSSKEGKGVSTKGSGQSGEEVGYPDYKINPKPNYPMIARRSGYEGVVLLWVFVLENGKVGKIELEKSSGYGMLDKSAIDAVKDWIFIPAKKNRAPIPSWVTVPIRFELSSG